MPKPPTTIAEAKALIAKHNLDDQRDLILGGLRKAVRLKPGKPAKRRLPTGTSKFGGEPDLPPDADWPTYDRRPLHFLAQLNLADLPPRHIPTADLQRKGLLSFWYDTQGDRSGPHESTPARWQVRYYTKAGERRVFPEFDETGLEEGYFFWRPFPERRVEMLPMLCLSEDASIALDKLMFTVPDPHGEELIDNMDAFETDLLVRRASHDHRLLGSLAGPDSDPRLDAARHAAGWAQRGTMPKAEVNKINKSKKDWRLLAVFDSERDVDDWMWSDEGNLSFWIRDADLKKQRFDRIHGEIDSC